MKLPQKIIVGNWKMNTTVPEASLLLHRIHTELKKTSGVEVVVCPPYISLYCLHKEAMKLKNPSVTIGAQNISEYESGAYTSEISAEMLKGSCQYVLVGHSETRKYLHETSKAVAQKVEVSLRHKLRPILCVGETQAERNSGESKQVLLDQINTALHGVTTADLKNIAIAYEPIWAVGSGNFAKPAVVEDAVLLIRNALAQRFGRIAAAGIRILYGGSVGQENARAYLGLPGIDGLLVGGASLQYKEFCAIVRFAEPQLQIT